MLQNQERFLQYVDVSAVASISCFSDSRAIGLASLFCRQHLIIASKFLCKYAKVELFFISLVFVFCSGTTTEETDTKEIVSARFYSDLFL